MALRERNFAASKIAREVHIIFCDKQNLNGTQVAPASQV